MTFQEAIVAMKKGERIARVEWPMDQYLTLVFLSDKGEMDRVDDYVEQKLGIERPVLATRIDHFAGNKCLQQGWMAQADDIQAKWRLWVRLH